MVPAIIQSYLDGPASRPPTGTVMNLDSPPKHNTGPMVLAIACVILTTLAALGRAYSRIFVVKRLRTEDYLGLLACLSYTIIVYSFYRYWAKVGFFIHMWDLRGVDLVEVNYVGFVVNIGYALVLLFSKSAILLEWVHIFVPASTRNTFFWSARVMMVANICLYTSALIVVFAGCQPLQLFWDFWLPGHCIDRKARDTANAVFNVVLDVIILLLPQRVIWNLHMTSNRKTGVCVVFSVGLLVIVTSVGRLVGIITMDYPADLTVVFDTSYQFSIELEWLVAETTCVMLVLCVPALPRIISERTLLWTDRIADAWRSWKRPGRSSRGSDSKYSDGWDQVLPHHVPRTIGSVPNSRQRITDEELLRSNDDTQHNTLELAAVPGRCYTVLHGEAAQIGIKQPTEAGIVKTVEFDRHDDKVPKVSADQDVEQQHPWTKP